MTEANQEPHKIQIRFPASLWQKLEEEKARRLNEGGAARPETTAIVLEAVEGFLAAIKKKTRLVP